MKAGGACPRCTGKKFYVVDQATMPDPRYSNSFDPLSIAAALVPTGEMGFLGEEEAMARVTLEAWVCAGCGYVDLYARDLDVLERMAQTGKAQVRHVDRDDSAFR